MPPPHACSPESLLREWESFCAFGSQTRSTHFEGIPVLENEFWTSAQRAAHSLHEISYRACYKPQLPAFFIEHLTCPGELVYDPFMGRGTTLVEARLRGRRAAGNDANPLSVRLAAPRLNPPPFARIAARIEEIPLAPIPSQHSDLHVFFHPQTLGEIEAWRDYFLHRRQQGTLDDVDAWIEMVACNRLTGHSPGFFSVYTLPPNQATSIRAQRAINEKRGQLPTYRDTRRLILRKSRQLLRDPLPPSYHAPTTPLLTRSAAHTPELPDATADLIVTSPPFLNVVDYLGDNWLRMWFCSLDAPAEPLWQFRRLDAWIAAMAETFREQYRLLRPGGHLAFEVGEVRKATILLERELPAAARAAGFQPVCILINSQTFTKTSNCWGVENNLRGTNSNRILLLQKP